MDLNNLQVRQLVTMIGIAGMPSTARMRSTQFCDQLEKLHKKGGMKVALVSSEQMGWDVRLTFLSEQGMPFVLQEHQSIFPSALLLAKLDLMTLA